MPTLLQINGALAGSTGWIVEGIARAAIENGWDSYIAYGRAVRPTASTLIKIGNKKDVLCHVLQTRLFDKHGLASKNATKKLIKEIKRIKPDIIQLHVIHNYYLNYQILFDYLSIIDIPIVWTFHDCWAFTGHCPHFVSVNCERWEKRCYSCPLKGGYPRSILFDRSSKNFNDKKNSFLSLHNLTIVTVSDWLSSVIEKSFFKDIPIRRIYNGVDTAILSIKDSVYKIRKKYNIPLENYIVLGVAGIWSPTKGLNDFVQLREILSKNYTIVLLGLSKKQINQMPEGVIGIEHIETLEDLADIYSAANVLFNPSKQETFGMTTAESLSCGVPAIVYNVTACPEIVSDDTGAVLKQGDIQSVRREIEKICREGKAYYQFSCRQRVINLFQQDKQCNKYIDLYRSLLKK